MLKDNYTIQDTDYLEDYWLDDATPLREAKKKSSTPVQRYKEKVQRNTPSTPVPSPEHHGTENSTENSTEVSTQVSGLRFNRDSDTRSNLIFKILPEGALVSPVLNWDDTEVKNRPYERRIDWITFINNRSTEESFVEVVDKIMLGGFWGKQDEVVAQIYDIKREIYSGGDAYTQMIKNDLGIKLQTRKRRVEGKSEIRVKLPNAQSQDDSPVEGDIVYGCNLAMSGSVLSSLYKPNDIRPVVSLILFMAEQGYHPSRIDFAVDCWDANLIPNMGIAVAQGNCRGFKKGHPDFDVGTLSVFEQNILGIDENNPDDRIYYRGYTLNMGSRESDFFRRGYFLFVKHGIIGSRIEAEIKGKLVRKVANMLIDAYREGTQSILSVFDAIFLARHNFIDRSKQKGNGSLKDCPELTFWVNFKARLSESTDMDFKIEQPKPNLQTRHAWQKRQLKANTRVFYEGLGEEMFIQYNKYLIALDKEKEKDRMPNWDNEYMKSVLQQKGIHALMSQAEIAYAKTLGIEFKDKNSALQNLFFGSGVVPVDEDKTWWQGSPLPITNQRILKAMLKKQKTDGGVSGDNKLRLEMEAREPINIFQSDDVYILKPLVKPVGNNDDS